MLTLTLENKPEYRCTTGRTETQASIAGEKQAKSDNESVVRIPTAAMSILQHSHRKTSNNRGQMIMRYELKLRANSRQTLAKVASRIKSCMPAIVRRKKLVKKL